MVEWRGGDRHRQPLSPGLVSSQARRATDSMFMAAAKTLARLSPTEKDKQAVAAYVWEPRYAALSISNVRESLADNENPEDDGFVDLPLTQKRHLSGAPNGFIARHSAWGGAESKDPEGAYVTMPLGAF